MNFHRSYASGQSVQTLTPAPANLHEQFVSLNFQIIGMKNKLMVLLLEIYQKEIYKEHKCADIFEYAFKYARISRERVQKALRTLRNTEDKPILRAQIASHGLNKVAMVAKLATPETEKFFAHHVETMRQPVLQTFVKEIRAGKPEVPKMSIELDEEMQIIFNQLKQKQEKQDKKELSNQATLRMILQNAKDVSEDVSAQTKIPKNNNVATTKIAKESKRQPDAPSPGTVTNQTIIQSHKPIDDKTKNVLGDVPPKFASRTISVPKYREIAIKQNGKCAYPCCTKPIENLHHTVPFAFARNHQSVVGLCKIHHEFCHHGVIRHELKDPENWELSLKPHLSQFDLLKLKYKQ